jgi:ferredoxin/flavodoxin---NADP+ reductase
MTAHVTDSKQIGTIERPLRVAIVGAGPAGFHAAMALLAQQTLAVEIDLFDRLPTPYGLVRAGVAPDHQKVKGITRVYERLGQDPRFAFFGNVTLGRDIEVEDLLATHDQLLFATGNEGDRRLGIPGEHLLGCVPASVFVGWYNGHPDYRDAAFDFSAKRVAIIGNGNVAIDVARMLSKSPDELARTDIADHALDALRENRIEEIIVIGRRGPLQANFTPAELRELLAIPQVCVWIRAEELALDPESERELEQLPAKSAQRRNLELLSLMPANRGANTRSLEFRFLASPVEFIGDAAGQLRQMRVEKNALVKSLNGKFEARPTGEQEVLDVGAVFVSIGSEGLRIPGLPYDEGRGVIANIDGRLVDPASSRVIPRQYCTGWARTGPRGLIAAQKVGSAEVVSRMLSDVAHGSVAQAERSGRSAIASRLETKGIRFVSFADWQVVDAEEIERGRAREAPRSKLVEIPQMIALIEMQRRGW